jgi:hypothetical protein
MPLRVRKTAHFAGLFGTRTGAGVLLAIQKVESSKFLSPLRSAPRATAPNRPGRSGGACRPCRAATGAARLPRTVHELAPVDAPQIRHLASEPLEVDEAGGGVVARLGQCGADVRQHSVCAPHVEARRSFQLEPRASAVDVGADRVTQLPDAGRRTRVRARWNRRWRCGTLAAWWQPTRLPCSSSVPPRTPRTAAHLLSPSG